MVTTCVKMFLREIINEEVITMEQLHSNTIETSCKPGKHLTLDERGIIQTLHQQGQTRIFKWVMEHTGFSGSIEHILQSGVQQLMQPPAHHTKKATRRSRKRNNLRTGTVMPLL